MGHISPYCPQVILNFFFFFFLGGGDFSFLFTILGRSWANVHFLLMILGITSLLGAIFPFKSHVRE